MAYKIIVSHRAQHEIENAIEYYVNVSTKAPAGFIKSLEESYRILSLNPYFRICYSTIRTIPLNKFPFSLFYILNEKECKIKILACFHSKLHPKRRPKNKIG